MGVGWDAGIPREGIFPSYSECTHSSEKREHMRPLSRRLSRVPRFLEWQHGGGRRRLTEARRTEQADATASGERRRSGWWAGRARQAEAITGCEASVGTLGEQLQRPAARLVV